MPKREKGIEESVNWLGIVIEKVGDGITVSDERGHFEIFNSKIREITGYTIDEVNNSGDFSALIYPDPQERREALEGLKEVVKDGRHREAETIIHAKDGSRKTLLVATTLISYKHREMFLSIYRDITERKKAEDEIKKSYLQLKEAQAQLVQSAKMAALGTLGAGIAHQLNQPLTGIRTYVQAILEEINTEHPFYDDLKVVEDQTGYMRDIINNISGFARQSKFNKQPIDINEPLENAFQLLSEHLRISEIILIKQLGANLPRVFADFNQMQQVFVNFIVNARESMVDLLKEKEKKLTVSTRVINENRFVEIVFSDTGKGISQEIKNKIFEPFFSTKVKGVGLGLSLNHGIIEEHGGRIEVESEEGKGATFRVILPAIT